MRRKTKARPRDDLAETREAPAAARRLPLLTAAEAVIRERGFDSATIEEIATRAGVSIDVFYAHFAGKPALLRLLAERWVERMTAVTDESTRSGIWETASPAEVIDVAARSAIDAIHENAPVVRAILAHGTRDPALTVCLRKIGALLTRRVVKVLKESKREGDVRIEERQVAFCLLLAISLAHHAILVGADSTGAAFDKDQLTAEASAVIAAYLGTPAPRAVPPPSPSAHARTGKLPTRGNIRAT